MKELVAEFSGWNDFDLKQAFTAACRFVSDEGGVEVVDATHVSDSARSNVALAVYAADQAAIVAEPCTSALAELVQRQVDDIRMALGVAATGAWVSQADAHALAVSLGQPPAGAVREVAAAPTLGDLYDLIVRWLQVVVASRPRQSGSAGSLAEDAQETIADNLPTSGSSPAAPLKLRRRL